jgi:hypothetical protein
MPRKKSKSKTPYQGSIFLFEPDSDGNESASVSLLIHAAVILELAEQIKAGDAELTQRDQVKFGGRLYEPDSDTSYFESGMVWSSDIDRDDWEELVEEFEDSSLEDTKSSRTKKSKRTKGQTRSRR